jgi:signal peptidase II
VAPAVPSSGARRAKTARLLVIAGLVVLIDQATKAIVLHTMPLYQSLTVVPGLFNLTHIQNPGGAFGFLSGQGIVVRRLVFVCISAAAAAMVFWLYRETPEDQPWPAFGLALIFGGALGNLVDRVRIGKVVDFLDLYVGKYHWPAFNVADSAITVGILIFVGHLLVSKNEPT